MAASGDIYVNKARWKIYLAIAGIIILLISMFYTNYLVQQIAEGERDKANLFGESMQRITLVDDLNEDITYEQLVMEKSSKDIPIILVDDRGKIAESYNFPDNADLEKELELMKTNGPKPIEGFGYFTELYYKNTNLLTQLKYFPLIQILLLLAFFAVGYAGFSSARKAEQNRVWAGMAKETAHQLGTPISAIMAWIEQLKLGAESDPDQLEIIGELSSDVKRLELVADRFSKIGSAPVLEKTNIFSQLEESRKYMQRRAARKIAFDFPDPKGPLLFVKINKHLFEWVVENLIRNSLDSMDGQGKITAEVYEDKGYVYLDLSDTGSGIPSNKFNMVFQPGFSTKKRGWGLGLSLAKRIIENYHSGKIFVKKSTIGAGTTFTIMLPKS